MINRVLGHRWRPDRCSFDCSPNRSRLRDAAVGPPSTPARGGIHLAIRDAHNDHRAWVRALSTGLVRDVGTHGPEVSAVQLVLRYRGSMPGAQLTATLSREGPRALPRARRSTAASLLKLGAMPEHDDFTSRAAG